MPGERISVEMAASTVRAGIACALAEALMVGIDECESEGVPLSQVQRTYLARGSIMAFDEAGRSGDALSTWSSLERLRMAGR